MDPVLRREPLDQTIDRERYVPAYLSLVANSLQWSGSQLYLRDYGIGINDWRVLTALGNRPGSTAMEICSWINLHKSVVSRSLKMLQNLRLVATDPKLGRRRMFLTPGGAALHEQIMPIALQRERILLSGFSEDEIVLLRQFLQRMYENIPAVRQYDGTEDLADTTEETNAES